MADRVSASSLKPQNRQSKQNPRTTSNLRSRFLLKALIATFFFIVVPILPSIAPEFFHHSLFSQIWELLHIVFVGIAVSYGLFSRRYDDSGGGEAPPKADPTQSYLSRLLPASDVFDDDGESKVQAWRSQYVRNEPELVVADKNQSSVIRDDDHKPLLLPVRSLKARVSDENGGGDNSRVSNRPYSRSRSYSSNSPQKEASNWDNRNLRSESLKSMASDFNTFSRSDTNPATTEASNHEQNAALPSPIPWRTRSQDPPMAEIDPSLVKTFPAPACLFEPPQPPPLPSYTNPPLMNSTTGTSDPCRTVRSTTADEEEELVENLLSDYANAVEDDEEEEDQSRAGLELDNGDGNGGEDEGPDVDKKADEFIAKFREQIRLQRIESIKRSTGQFSRGSVK